MKKLVPSSTEDMAEMIHQLADPDMKPKELIKTVKAAFPGATRKDVVRAAFLAIISHADDQDPERAARLHELALKERGSDDDLDSASPAAGAPIRH